MTKLEHYLDQVCRGVGGPRALRQHIRQELREHLLDAAAEHRSAGMSDEAAIDRALEEFGGPEQLRSELEATHGQRMMAVVIDKAMQWKEHTMKSKWLWATLAHLVLLLVIATQVWFIWAVMIFILPKFIAMVHHGLMDATDPVVAWGISFLDGVRKACQNQLWFLIPLILLWLLFEWRVRSDNKTAIRLGALGTAALTLMVVVSLTAAALVLPLILSMPGLNARHPEPIVMDRMAGIDAAIAALKQAALKQDWGTMNEQASQASKLLGELSHMGSAAPALMTAPDQSKLEAIRAQLQSARDRLTEARRAIWDKDAARFRACLQQFNEIYDALRHPTTGPNR